MLNYFKDYNSCIRISYHILGFVQQKNITPDSYEKLREENFLLLGIHNLV